MKFLWLYAFFTYLVTVRSAPTKSQAVYDQKQTGGYNIQVHLKDFQIIALLGDEALGDYDYNYDYSDFTIKPPSGNITLKPPPEENNVTSPSSTSGAPDTTSTTSEKPTENTSKADPEKSTTEKIDTVPFSTSSPDRIKVQIIDEANPIVPADDLGLANAPPLGEVLHQRRCASGYNRDKKGRCRRVRRPGHPHQFDIGRLASNLAARFRGASGEEGLLSHSESVENV